MPGRPETKAQDQVLQRWVASLAELPEVKVIWLEGSLADDTANPWSDIDLRIAIADDAFDSLWGQNRALILEGLGEHLLLWNKGFVRALTTEGVIVELAARKVSELPSQELYEWKLLLNRLPDSSPRFEQRPKPSPAEAWPAEAVSADDVNQRTRLIIHYMANAPQDFSSREVCAAAYTLNCLREYLFEVMYQRLGIRTGKRNKELSRIFPPEFIADLMDTYMRVGEAALDLPAIAAAQLRTFAALGRHLQALSDQVGGGFEPVWYARLYSKVSSDLRQFM